MVYGNKVDYDKFSMILMDGRIMVNYKMYYAYF